MKRRTRCWTRDCTRSAHRRHLRGRPPGAHAGEPPGDDGSRLDYGLPEVPHLLVWGLLLREDEEQPEAYHHELCQHGNERAEKKNKNGFRESTRNGSTSTHPVTRLEWRCLSNTTVAVEYCRVLQISKRQAGLKVYRTYTRATTRHAEDASGFVCKVLYEITVGCTNERDGNNTYKPLTLGKDRHQDFSTSNETSRPLTPNTTDGPDDRPAASKERVQGRKKDD